MLQVTKEAQVQELEQILDYISFSGYYSIQDVEKILYKEIANHENINYSIWLRCFCQIPNECFDNPVLDLILLESGGLNFYEDIYPHRELIQAKTILKSQLLQIAFSEKFPAIEARIKREKEEKEENENRLIQAAKLEYGVEVGDIVSLKNFGEGVFWIITGFRLLTYNDKSVKVRADIEDVTDQGHRSSIELEDMQKADLSKYLDKSNQEEDATVLRHKYGLSPREANKMSKLIAKLKINA